MTRSLPIGDAKAHFAKCVREAEGGGTIVLTRHGRPVARLGPLDPDIYPAPLGEAGVLAEPRVPYDLADSEAILRSRCEELERMLEEEVWARVPPEQLGKRIGKRERERILGLENEPG